MFCCFFDVGLILVLYGCVCLVGWLRALPDCSSVFLVFVVILFVAPGYLVNSVSWICSGAGCWFVWLCLVLTYCFCGVCMFLV